MRNKLCFIDITSADTTPPARPIGVNIAGNLDYDTDKKWVNVIELFRPWNTTNVTAAGYPLSDALTTSNLRGYDRGVYKLSYEGTATLTFMGNEFVSRADRQTVGDLTTEDITLDPSRDVGSLTIAATGLDPADPLHNLRLITPGYEARPNQVFTDEFLRSLQPFGTLRTMDFTETNFNTVSDWADRTLPTDFKQTHMGVRGNKGVAWEYIIELANEAHKDVWINVPYLATPDYVTQLADLFRANLDPSLHVYLEYSNEVWNSRFDQWRQNDAAAHADSARFLPLGLQTWKWDDAELAYKLVTAARIFKAEFGANRASAILPVLAGQATNPAHIQNGLNFIQAYYGEAPSAEIALLAIAPYIDLTNTGVPDDETLTLDAIFAGLYQRLDFVEAHGIVPHAALAAQFGLGLVSYEGGQQLVPKGGPSTVNYQVKEAAQTDPRMSALYTDLLNRWEADGGGLFMHYNHISPDGGAASGA